MPIYKSSEVTQAERRELSELTVHCRICKRDIGTTNNILHTEDICEGCKARWKKEMEIEQRRLRYNQMVLGLVNGVMAMPRR